MPSNFDTSLALMKVGMLAVLYGMVEMVWQDLVVVLHINKYKHIVYRKNNYSDVINYAMLRGLESLKTVLPSC